MLLPPQSGKKRLRTAFVVLRNDCGQRFITVITVDYYGVVQCVITVFYYSGGVLCNDGGVVVDQTADGVPMYPGVLRVL